MQEETKTPVEYLMERYTYVKWMRERDEISRETADKWMSQFFQKAKEMENSHNVNEEK